MKISIVCVAALAASFAILSVRAGEAGPTPFPEFSAPRAITSGPHDHFLANYFGISCWSPDNRYVLALETDLRDRMPDGTPCTLGVVDLENGNRFIPVTTTRCWNFQEAAMAHWLPQEPDTFVFNDVRDGTFCAVVMNWRTKRERHYPHPVSAVSEDGTWALSINYSRLFLTRPDYGYAGNGQDARADVVFPEDDGIFRLDLRTGEAKLIVSCAAVKDRVPAVTGERGMSYLCHTVISKDMKRIYFLSRSVNESFAGVKKFKGVKWETTAFTAFADGTGIRKAAGVNLGRKHSHFNWKPARDERSARTMVVTSTWKGDRYTHIEFTVGEEDRARQLGGPVMDFDGHAIYSPDGQFVSGDGYWDKDFYRHWKIVRLADNAVKDFGSYYIPKQYRDTYCRCDLHPRWRADGRQIAFNSVHEGTRQVYVRDLVPSVYGSSATADSELPPLVPKPRKFERTQKGAGPASALRIAKVNCAKDASVPPEGYRLKVNAEGVVEIASSDDAGAFYARQTLRQLGDEGVPCCEIEDAPAYRWRGVMLDEGRHFFGKEAVKRLLDQMARFKLNRFHWHLTDDQGWRIDVPGYPELVRKGSVRPQTPMWNTETNGNGQVYGPFFYRESDLREVVAYAAERHIEVVPEFDMPGHCYAVLAAYPELGCEGHGATTGMAWGRWGVSPDVLCIGNDRTVRFCEDVFDFLCSVFPSKVIHLACNDEVPMTNWKKCPKCQKRMRDENLGNEKKLRVWMAMHMCAHAAKKGRRIVGWQDCPDTVDGDATKWPRDMILQSWTSDVGLRARGPAEGYDTIFSNFADLYWTIPIGVDHDPNPYRAWARDWIKSKPPLSLEKAYRFNPAQGIAARDRHHILGGECCIWTEGTPNASVAEWKTWPRTAAVAELLWSDPAEPRDYADFERRMAPIRIRMIDAGVNCSPLR